MRNKFTVRLIATAILVLTSSACASSAKSATNPNCPQGGWQLSPSGLRELLGAETTGNNNDAATSGNVYLTMTESEMRYEFYNVVLAGINQGTQRNIGISGSLINSATQSPTSIDSSVRMNSIFVYMDGLPAKPAFTAFVSSELERNLTGTFSYTCTESALQLTNSGRNETTTWNAARNSSAK